ncbi:MAG: PilZ domain-containing protein [Proteobacteria bacterium]|nr:PilZ domain-containing protein [Pseudomonadota bacterium]MBU1596762.1 PilZ domain-containing protein [Pseudomonadota bacterium]
MGKDSSKTVLVLTERPDEYSRDLGRLGLKLEFATKVSGLLDRLLETPTSGFVLEVERVMRAKRSERDHLLKVAGSFPLLRTMRKGEDQTLTYLDDPGCFAMNVKVFSPRCVRCHTRVPSRLNVLIAPEDDAAFANPVRSNLLDISASGGFAYTLEDFTSQEFVHLRILELTDPAPIQAHIRWRKHWGKAHTLPGIGLLFVDIRPAQLDELVTRYISPPEDPGPLKVTG